MNTKSITTSLVRIVAGTGAVLLVPLVAMQFTDQVNWSTSDFVVIGILLLVAGLAYEVLSRLAKNKDQRFVIGLVVLGVVAYLWAELAVGIFTNWGS